MQARLIHHINSKNLKFRKITGVLVKTYIKDYNLKGILNEKSPYHIQQQLYNQVTP